jgi:hypothetical protein
MACRPGGVPRRGCAQCSTRRSRRTACNVGVHLRLSREDAQLIAHLVQGRRPLHVVEADCEGLKRAFPSAATAEELATATWESGGKASQERKHFQRRRSPCSCLLILPRRKKPQPSWPGLTRSLTPRSRPPFKPFCAPPASDSKGAAAFSDHTQKMRKIQDYFAAPSLTVPGPSSITFPPFPPHFSQALKIQLSTSVLSHHKLNSSSWIQGFGSGIRSLYCEKTNEIGLFSKIVTLRICRILYKLRSNCSCFFKMATST